jgi:hypothetical protein
MPLGHTGTYGQATTCCMINLARRQFGYCAPVVRPWRPGNARMRAGFATLLQAAGSASTATEPFKVLSD